MDFRKATGWLGIILLTILGVSYIFLGNDLIPDSLASIGPAGIIGYVDDIVAVLILVFVGRRWWTYVTGQRAKKEPASIWLILGYIAIATAVLWYIFLGADLIPDSTPWVGFMDDALAVLMGIFAASKLRRQFT